jgi:hypothetical protein
VVASTALQTSGLPASVITTRKIRVGVEVIQ